MTHYALMAGDAVVGVVEQDSPPTGRAYEELTAFTGLPPGRVPGSALRVVDGALHWVNVNEAVAWAAVRAERKRRFEPGDDEAKKAFRLGVPMPAAWAAYQQALADITEQPDPFNIIWPTPPA